MYATLDDMLIPVASAELVQVTDDARTGTVNEDRVDWALDAASREIDAYIAVRYGLPLAETPEVLKAYCIAIARYKLHERKATIPDSVKLGYDNATRALRDLAAGKAVLDIAGVEAPAAPNVILTGGAERVFSRDSLRGL
jgi:phage gp36-like protein